MPVLGIIASQISGHLFAPSGAYDSIATTTVGAVGAPSVTFSSIPSTYTHLQIRGIFRNTANVGGDAPSFRINSDTGSNYVEHYLNGSGSSPATAGYAAAANKAYFAVNSADASMTTGVYSAMVMDILDYANIYKNKTIRTLVGTDNNGSGNVTLSSNLWLSTAAIDTFTIYPYNLGSNDWLQYTQFALYGIKGA